MLRYVFKRILSLIPVIIFVSFIVFALMDMAPGTIIDTMVSEAVTEEVRAELMARYDLDKPLVYRYGKYMFKLVQGDLGTSDVSNISIWTIYITRLPNTLLLSLAALVIGSVVSIPMGIRAARHAGKLTDTATTTFTLIGMSMPSFWLGLLLMFVFSYWLGWLPAGDIKKGILSYILPAVCSGLLLMANSARQTRSSMLEVLNADFLRTARAKGVPEAVVIRKHALGNAWIPILTTIGTSLSVSLAGSAVIETVFSWPGVGRATVDAVNARDVTGACGLVIMTTILYVVLQLVVDLLYAFIDPRIKSQYASVRKKKPATGEAFGVAVKSDAAIEAAKMEGPAIAARLVATMEPEVAVRPMAASETVVSGTAAAETETTVTETVAAAEPEAAAGLATIEATTVKVAAAVDSYTTTAAAVETYAAVATADHRTAPDSHSARPADTIEQIIKQYKKRSRMGDIFHSIKRNKSAMAGLIIIVLLFMVLIGSLFISFESVTESASANRFRPPDWQFPFGGDNMGRNTFLRTIYGARYSIVIGFGSVAIATILGVFLGSFAGFYGGITDDIIMRASDVLASIPGMLLGMVIVTVLGQSLQNLIIAVGVTAIPVFIRITRASVLTVRNNEFVEAARAIGISNTRIVFTQVLTNGLSPIIVTFTASIGLSIIVAASLSFLGFGVPVPHPEWGALVSTGRNYIRNAPWLTTFPGLFIMITVLAFNLLGDGLRDALDPKMKK